MLRRKKLLLKSCRSLWEQNQLYRRILGRDAIMSYEADLTDGIIKDIYKAGLSVQLNGERRYRKLLQSAAENFIHADYRALFLSMLLPENLIRFYHEGRDELRFEFLSCEAMGEYQWQEETVYLVEGLKNHHIYAIFFVKDIDFAKKLSLEMQKCVQHDELTGLYNRRAFVERVKRYFAGKTTQAALLLVDVDNFKYVNDVYGHKTGDKVLCYAAEQLSSFAADWFVCRLGGDEFAIFIADFRDRDEVIEQAQELCRFMRIKFQQLKFDNNLSCSIGVAFSPEHAADYFSLYEKADEAQYRAKRLGKNCTCIFSLEQLPDEISMVNFEWVLNSVPYMMYVINEAYDILYCNEPFARMFGVNMRSYHGRKCYEMIYGRKSPCENCFCRRVQKDDEPFSMAVDFEHEGVMYHRLAHGNIVSWNLQRICIISLLEIE